MLQFILGRASSGKTEKVLELIGRDIKSQDGKAVFLVPEQFSFEAERILLERFSEAGAKGATVVNFTHLFDEVGRQSGLIAGSHMSDSDAIVLMGRALFKEKDNLKCFDRYVQNQNFAAVCAATVSELKMAAVDSKALKSAAALVSGRLKNKLEDLAVIMDSYNIEVSGKFIDPKDSLDKLYDMLNITRYFEGKNVYIDGFKGFTGQQYKIIRKILAQANNVYITLCCDDKKEYDGVFDTAIRTKKSIESYAKQENVKIEENIVLKESFYDAPELKELEQKLFLVGESYCEDAQNVTVCAAKTEQDEADYAMHIVRKLIEEKKMRYKDFAIIVRNAQNYENHIAKAAKKYDVACYLDTKVSAAILPLFVFANAALDATLNLSSENILKYFKTGMCSLDDEQISRLENYAYIWDIKGKDWANEWTMNPQGLRQLDEKDAEKQEKELQELNALRKKVIDPILSLRKVMNEQNTIESAKALWDLLSSCNVAESLAELADKLEKDGKFKEADMTRRSYDVFCDVLDHTVSCLGKVSSKKEFADAFKLAAQSTDMGSVPQTLDQVLFGTADRIRTHRPKVVIALGLNVGEWPMSMPQSNLLSSKDRSLLSKNGLAISDIDNEFAADENFLCYSALCAPSERLYAVYHTSSGKDKTLCSYVVTALCETLPNCKKETWPNQNTKIEDIKTENTAFCALSESIQSDSVLSRALLEYFDKKPEWAGRLKAVLNADKSVDAILSKSTIDKIVPKKISMSPSASETFSRCRFSYFCKYLLGAKIIEKADLNVLQRGTMVHFVLEKLVDVNGKDLASFTNEQIKQDVKKFCCEYMASIKGLDDIIGARMRYLFYLIELQIIDVALRLRDEFAQSGFEPVKCELEINPKGDIKPLEYSANGVTISVNGKVDRVDKWEGYLRIVDYKTGTKKFRLSDVLVGQNMQMLLYLYTMLKSDQYKDFAPAGILYMPALRSKEEDNSLAMNGLLCEDEELIRQMERENAGQFVPKLSYTNSGSIDKRTSAKTYIKKDGFGLIFKKIDKVMEDIATKLGSGDIAVSPMDCAGEDACKYCDFSSVCGIEDKRHQNTENVAAADVIERLEEEMSGDEC